MVDFDKIIKQKAEQFEVPYNETHWTEMNNKLNAIRLAKIKTTFFSVAAVITILAISSYFIFFNKVQLPLDNNIATNNNAKEKNTSKNIFSKKEKIIQKTTITTTGNNIANQKSLKKPKTDVSEPNNENSSFNKNSLEEIKEENNISNNIIVDNAVNADFIVYNNKVCLGEKVNFESVENDFPVSYKWNFGDGTISYEANPTHLYNDSYIYTVTLTLRNRQTGVEKTSIQHDVVNILPKPSASFSYVEVSINQDNDKLKYPYTKFSVEKSTNQNTYNWDFGNGETSNSSIGKTIYKEESKNYFVTLTVENSYGCQSHFKKEVLNKNGMDLYAQTGINPNSNIDKNKVFMPGKLSGWDIRFEMTILNKTGNTVYKTSNKNEPWNGRMNNAGEVLDGGVYLWQVITFDSENNPYQHTGKITLVK